MTESGEAAAQNGIPNRDGRPSAAEVLTVILVAAAADPDEPSDGEWWGSNAWRANSRDRRLYGEADT